jgi:hypothetical protein
MKVTEARAAVSPQVVSRKLREAGFSKAGRYTPFGGYVDKDGNKADGFIVKRRYDYIENKDESGKRPPITKVPSTIVLTTIGRLGSEMREKAFEGYAALLTEAGFVVGRQGSSLEVFKKEEEL